MLLVYASHPVNPLALIKPEYLFRPAQLVRRLRAYFLPLHTAWADAPLPFGGNIRVPVDDVIGRALLHLGVYDLPVSEVIWRITEPREAVIDIGANIGYFTRLFAARVGPNGRVTAFEAHPILFEELRSNLENEFGPMPGYVDLRSEAVSSREGVLSLAVPDEFATNRGVARVVGEGLSANGTVFQVPAVRLDDAIEPDIAIGVVKMDVEGHESSVLAGATRMLQSGQVRDWVFEELTAESTVSQTFQSFGYDVFLIERQFRGPRLAEVRPIELAGRWEPPSLLATLDGARAQRICSDSGWKVLSRR